MRMRSTVVRVANLPDGRSVEVVYEQGGRLHRVRGKSVVMAIGAWVAKHVVQELPEARRAALNQYLYSPILMVNVALRNWRFLDKLGFSAARWFEGFGFYCNIRQPMIVDGRSAPFHPDKPIVMTVYVPFPKHDLPLEAQGPAARAELYATSYAQYEQMVVEQMQRMFGPGGFDARRDIAGIVLNRWGHAFVTPPPGFFFGLNGGPAPIKASQEPLGRIRFAQTGMEGWAGAAAAGQRAASEVLQIA
jgi:spermidine dehydrogenase